MHQITEQKQAKTDRPARRNRQIHTCNQKTLGEVLFMYLDTKILNKISSNEIQQQEKNKP